MIKGCKRNIIMVKETGSRYFDSAYFVLRSDLPPSCRDTDMLAEARRMIAACDDEKTAVQALPKKKMNKRTAAVLSVLLAVTVCLAVAVLILL